MKDQTQYLRWIVFAIILFSGSLLVNEIIEFDYSRFKEFTTWAKRADPNQPWWSRENFLQWSFYAINVGIFYWKGYLLYSFTYFLKILDKVEKGLYFHEKVILYFKKLGKAFIYYTVNIFVLNIIMSFVGDYQFKFVDEFKSELTYMIPAALSFYLLAGIFEKAKNLKEENDLTI